MAAIIINGKTIAAGIREELKERAGRLTEKGIKPCLAVVIAGENPASVSYIKGAQKTLAAAGLEVKVLQHPETITENELLSNIETLNKDDKVHGILVQMPLPAHINEEKIIYAMDPEKDVDCFHPVSLGKLLLGQPGFLPCTPAGVVALLSALQIPTAGRHAVIVGRSNIVGKPLALLLSRRQSNATVTICHTGTHDLSSYTLQADILIAAAGSPGLIKGNMIKKGAAVIDVGVSQRPGGNGLCGDVEYNEALETAGWITPVPGGTGPLTTTMLMRNVVEAAERAVF